MTVTQALDQFIDTGHVSSEAVGALFEAGLVYYEPFSAEGFKLNWYGRFALAKRRKERA